jgi:DNA-binding CsgD family transcriptional regulator
MLALPSAEGALRARLLSLRGTIEAHAGSVREAPAILLEAVAATTETSLQIELLEEAGEAAAYAGDVETVRCVSERVAAIPAVSERDRFLVAGSAGWAAAFAGEHERADAAFRDALARVASLDDPRALIWAADSAMASFGQGSGLPYADAAVDLARKRGLLSLLPMALHRQTWALLWNSRFDRAYAAAQEGYQLAVDLGYGAGLHLSGMAAVEAIWGRDDEARAHAAEALAIGKQSGSSLCADTAESALGVIELTAGRPDRATDRLRALVSLDRPGAHPVLAMQAIPDLIEAAVRAGRLAEVTEPLARYREWVRMTTTDSGSALLARCQALVEPSSELFEAAIGCGPALSPFERARTRLLYGEWLRRERRRQDARTPLRAALEAFRALGAVPWAARAEAELRATGETTRRRDPSTLDQLTPQELQIARLVADGLTNRDVAAQLYLSPRTIDYHLRKVFSKLGLTSRNELIRYGLAAEDDHDSLS